MKRQHQKEDIEQFSFMTLEEFKPLAPTIDTNSIQVLIARSGFYAVFPVATKTTATVVFRNEREEDVYAYTLSMDEIPASQRQHTQWKFEPAQTLAVTAYLRAVDLYFSKEMNWLKATLIGIAREVN